MTRQNELRHAGTPRKFRAGKRVMTAWYLVGFELLVIFCFLVEDLLRKNDHCLWQNLPEDIRRVLANQLDELEIRPIYITDFGRGDETWIMLIDQPQVDLQRRVFTDSVVLAEGEVLPEVHAERACKVILALG